mgnify:CR=1 FL=1
MNEAAVDIKNLGFCYPGQQHFTLRNLDLVVKEGERFGLFGPNGAGKTTLIGCMTGLLESKEGSIHLFGEKVSPRNKSFNHLFGYVPQDFAFYQELTPEENLAFFGAWSGLRKEEIRQRTKELLQVLGLSDVAGKPVEKFSGGMKRRVNLAIGVIHRPRLLFLDEPTVGVDVQSRHAIIDFLIDLNKQGTTLIYTSHQLSEAQSLCNKIALIDEGRIIAIDTLEQLLQIHEEIGLEGLFLKLTGKAYRDSNV